MKNIKALIHLLKLAQDDLSIINIRRNEYDDEYDDEDTERYESEALKLFEGSGIRMMNKDEFYSVCTNETNEVVGTLVFHQDGYWDCGEETLPIFYFSRVVRPDYQGKGIAKKLLEDFLGEFSHEAIIKSETWNRKLDSDLVRKGFVEEKRVERWGHGEIVTHVLVPSFYKEDYFSEIAKG